MPFVPTTDTQLMPPSSRAKKQTKAASSRCRLLPITSGAEDEEAEDDEDDDEDEEDDDDNEGGKEDDDEEDDVKKEEDEEDEEDDDDEEESTEGRGFVAITLDEEGATREAKDAVDLPRLKCCDDRKRSHDKSQFTTTVEPELMSETSIDPLLAKTEMRPTVYDPLSLAAAT